MLKRGIRAPRVKIRVDAIGLVPVNLKPTKSLLVRFPCVDNEVYCMFVRSIATTGCIRQTGVLTIILIIESVKYESVII